MTREGTGHVEVVDGREELVLVRRFRATVEDVWASCTVPERLGRWIGTWSGEPGPGHTVEFVMTAEDGAPKGSARIVECAPPTRLLVDLDGPGGAWRVGCTLTEDGDETVLEFRMVLGPHVPVSEIGPGWEYYLDRLVVVVHGGEFCDFDEYYPGQADWRLRQAAAVESAG